MSKIDDALIRFTDKLGWHSDKLKQNDDAYDECCRELKQYFDITIEEKIRDAQIDLLNELDIESPDTIHETIAYKLKII